MAFGACGGGYATSIYRYRGGTVTLLASEPPTNGTTTVKTDGTNVYYIQKTPTNQALIMITPAGQVKVADGAAIGADYQLNQGWLAFTRNATGAAQVWRRSPDGINTQLTFYGTDSAIAALAPNGEVLFYNGSQLFLSKGSGPPWPVAYAAPSSGLTFFWQSDRWLAALGRSLYQLYTGAPQIASPALSPQRTFTFDLIAAVGQTVVVQSSPDLVHWMDLSTNVVADGTGVRVEDALEGGVADKFYRLRLQ